MPASAKPVLAALAALVLVACADGTASEHANNGHGHDGHDHGENGIDQARGNSAPQSGGDTGPKPELGLMTSLPLYWPLGADFSDLASGELSSPWQRSALEQRFEIVPLDTLSAIPALQTGAPDEDPLAGLERIAIIQPRGLSPADNVALDEWVRGGGELLLVLDPALTGDYHLPLGDPAMPSLAALIPPVVARWGLEVRYDEAQPGEPRRAALRGGTLPLWLSGTLARTGKRQDACTMQAEAALAQCRIGEGRVTVLADAALFEHRALAGEANEAIALILRLAFAR